SGDSLSVVRERCGQDLQRDLSTELHILRAIDFAHAAAANQRQDFVRAEAGARSQRHWIARGSAIIQVRWRLGAPHSVWSLGAPKPHGLPVYELGTGDS